MTNSSDRPSSPLVYLCLDGAKVVPVATTSFEVHENRRVTVSTLVETFTLGDEPAAALLAWLAGRLIVTPNANGIADLHEGWEALQDARAKLPTGESETMLHPAYSRGGLYPPPLDAVARQSIPEPTGPLGASPLLDFAKVKRRLAERKGDGA